MKFITCGIVWWVIALLPAWGADKSVEAENRLFEIGVHAQKLRQDAENVSQHLRSKQPAPQFLKDKIGTTADDMSKLQQLVKDFELRKFGLSEREEKEWEMLRNKADRLSIFYDRKKELGLADDPQKNRSLLRSHANGLAARAAQLQEAANRFVEKSRSHPVPINRGWRTSND
jgi:hypothetical protein